MYFSLRRHSPTAKQKPLHLLATHPNGNCTMKCLQIDQSHDLRFMVGTRSFARHIAYSHNTQVHTIDVHAALFDMMQWGYPLAPKQLP